MIHFLIVVLIFQVPALIPTIMESLLKVVRLDDKNQSQATGKFLTLFWMGFESVLTQRNFENWRIILKSPYLW